MAQTSEPRAVPKTSPPDGFDFTLHMRRLCVALASTLDELSHIQMDRVAIRFCQARKRVHYGVHASLTPLRFEGGALSYRRGGRTWTVGKLYDAAGREMLYLLSFYLPRFLERSFEQKLSTVVHELWHIGAAFDGDLRRHAGRCFAHGHSQKQYDAQVATIANTWLATNPPPASYEFLRSNFRQLERQHGRIYGQRIPTPKVVRR